MSLSSFEEKLRGTTTFCHQKKKKKKVPRMMMESQHRKIEEKFSFRVLQGKKRSNAFQVIFTRRKNNKARARGCVCVCVCRFRATRVNNTYTHRKKWRQTGCLEEETPPRVVSPTTKEIIIRAKTKTVSARQQICFPRKATSKTNETIHTIRKKRGEGERKSPNSF